MNYNKMLRVMKEEELKTLQEMNRILKETIHELKRARGDEGEASHLQFVSKN